MRAHQDGAVFLSLFRGAGSTLTAAKLLAEIGDVRGRYPSGEALAADAEMSPVAVESGRRKVASFRRACDKRLRAALAVLADSSRRHNPWAKDVYERARPRLRPPARRARAGPGLGAGDLADVAGRPSLRSVAARGRTATQHDRGLTQGV